MKYLSYILLFATSFSLLFIGSGCPDHPAGAAQHYVIPVNLFEGNPNLVIHYGAKSETLLSGSAGTGDFLTSSDLDIKIDKNGNQVYTASFNISTAEHVSFYAFGDSLINGKIISDAFTETSSASVRVVNFCKNIPHISVSDDSGNELFADRVYEGNNTVNFDNSYYHFVDMDAGNINLYFKNVADSTIIGNTAIDAQAGIGYTVYLYGNDSSSVYNGLIIHD
ncbi:MAG: hypothetical protein GC181_16095 [Bacteroidetes bacterium]|nr:hypothetical protein [Bacteroidota bacterium]